MQKPLLKSALWWGPIIIYILLMSVIVIFNVDWKLAHFWFQLEGQQWALKHNWITQALIHDVGHQLTLIAYIVVLLLYAFSFKLSRLKCYRHGLSYLAITLPLATLTVTLLKRLTSVDCPWSTIDFGGKFPYQSWLDSLWQPAVGTGHCFPAGHASSAYAFFAIYFLSRSWWPQRSIWVLVSVIAVGLIFGIAQQLRGAHFISHDLTSALICWLVSLLMWQRWSRQPALPLKAMR